MEIDSMALEASTVTDLNEITEQTSSEDIAAYAEQVAKEVEQERKGEEKSDAQIVSETSQPIKTPAETDSGREPAVDDGDESAEVKSQGEETGDTPEGPEWLTDEVKAEAAAYGIEAEEIADFADREELDRALRLFDKTALEAGRKALADGVDESPTRNEKGQFVKKEEPELPKEEAPRDGQYQVSLDPDLYDEEIIGEFSRMREHYESRLEALESHFAEADAIAKERQFDKFVDSLGHADLFGKTDKETPQEKQRREDLFVEVETYLRGREALGRPAELNETILNRIARSLFAGELGKKELKQRTRQISRQSQKRQGGSPTKPLPPRDDPRDEADRLYQELERA
jgi:hypothetical protein